MYSPLLRRYLFWTEMGAGCVQRINLANNDKVTLASRVWPEALSLDCTNKRVYWVTRYGRIYSSIYDGKSKTTIVKSGSLNYVFLGTFEDSAYFQKRNVRYINDINKTSGILSRRIMVNKTNYRDVVIVHNSLQTMGEFEQNYT